MNLRLGQLTGKLARGAVVAAFVGLFSVGGAANGESTGELPATVTFNAYIRPIFAKNCIGCHGGPKQAAGISFIYRESALAKAESGDRPIVPGDPAKSELIARITSTDKDVRMPPADHGPRLSDREVALLKKWIEQGAAWEEHWSFIPPKPQALPETKLKDWCREDLDRFVAAKLEKQNLQPSAEASRNEWLRRVTFDLIGVPPTQTEMDAFAADTSPKAYENVVDRLLQSPKYGERWASMWLDLARYADTVGFERDPNRSIWPYRDWLIRSLNADMPFDEFTIKQLAGDRLPHPTVDDRVATAFHRNTQTNTEGGTDDEEFRIAAVLDRTSTTWQVWGALTFGCTQCHSHPYDPIHHEDFYKFSAFFNSSKDADLGEDLPTFQCPEKQSDYQAAQRLDEQIAAARTKLREQALPIAEDAKAWTNFALDNVRSTGTAKLELRKAADIDAQELVVGGTISSHSQYTVAGGVPKGIEKIRALKLDALPKDLAAAMKIPESGFVLSKFSAELIPPGKGKPVALDFVTAFSDDAAPLLDPEDSLRDDWQGFAAYSKIDRPHWVVFVLRQPIEVAAGSRLKMVLKQNQVDSGNGPLVIERARFWLSADPRWDDYRTATDLEKVVESIHSLEQERAKLGGTVIPVMEEQAASERRATYVFERGNWLAKGAVVTPAVPAVFPPLESNAGGPPDRLAMARWLVSGKHPLTSRVLVNRIWAQLFGTGIVATTGDFGVSGALPSHPELLDYLALRFQNEESWHLKQLLRELVLSATYRQSARCAPTDEAADPENHWLWPGPRQRLTAEMIRDEALAVSGLLSEKMYGPPVMPPQPDGVWQTVYNGNVWATSAAGDQYRRAIYTFWKRTSGYPSMLTFDVPARDVCTVQRAPTNTPLQALVTLNDPAFLECAEGLAKRMAKEGGESLDKKIAWAYVQATNSEISAATSRALVSLYNDTLTQYQHSHGGAPDDNAAHDFALKIVAHSILNFDAALTR